MNTETKWTRFADVPEIPADAEIVALARSSKCYNGELDGQPDIEVFRRNQMTNDKWQPVVGWELFKVIPKELAWLSVIGKRGRCTL